MCFNLSGSLNGSYDEVTMDSDKFIGRRASLRVPGGYGGAIGRTQGSIEHGLWLFKVKFHMIFSKHLRNGVRQGKIRCSVRIWTHPHVKVGGWYRMEEGHIVVDSIAQISIAGVTRKLARESGFDSVDDLLRIARHGKGDNVYLIRFHYMPPGAVDPPIRVGSS
jgi:hypothetical protein